MPLYVKMGLLGHVVLELALEERNVDLSSFIATQGHGQRGHVSCIMHLIRQIIFFVSFQFGFLALEVIACP